MKKIKWLVIAACAAVMTLMLTACGEKFDPSAYVQASLDAAIHGDYAQYMELTGATEEEAQEEFGDVMEGFNEGISELGLSDEMNEQFETLMVDVCKKTKYQVGESREIAGGYEVDVEIQPITNVFDAEALEQGLTDAMDDYLNEVMTSGEVPTEEEITQWAGQKMYDLLSERAENIEYGEPQTVTIKIGNEENNYSPDEDSLEDAFVLMLGASNFMGEVDAAE